MKKLLLIGLCAAMLLVSLSSCVKIEEDEKDKKDTTTVAEAAETEPGEDTDASDGEEEAEEETAPVTVTSIKAEKIGSFSHNGSLDAKYGGYIISKSSKYGIVSLDGTKQTEVKYLECTAIGRYFKVSVSIPHANDVNSMNNSGLVGPDCTELVPMEYATLSSLSARYVKVIKVTEITEDQEQAIYSYSYRDENNENKTVYYKGEWKIYDVVNGNFLEGAVGTGDDEISVYGDFVSFKKNGSTVYLHGDGKSITEGTTFLNNGYYIIDEDGAENNVIGVLYDPDGNKMFEYDPEGYVPSTVLDKYVIAKRYDGTRTYVFTDHKGETVSAEFTSAPTLCGDVVYSGGYIYNLKGEQLIDTQFTYEPSVDNTFAPLMSVHVDWSDYYIINGKGEIVWQGNSDDSIYDYSYGDFCMYKRESWDYMYYSIKDGDYTIKGKSALSNMLVFVEGANGKGSVVEMFNGETLMSGYTDYDFINACDGNKYIAADKSNGTIDIYMLTVS